MISIYDTLDRNLYLDISLSTEKESTYNEINEGEIIVNGGIASISSTGKATFQDIEIGSRFKTIDVGENIQDAIDSITEGVILIRNGTHIVDYDIVLKSNMYLEGENADSTIIDFVNNTRSILIQGTNAYSTGTLSISNNSQTVTGVSTSWSTNVVAGMYILLGGIWYPITVVGSNTSLTIGIPFAGVTLSAGTTYTAAAIINDSKVTNLTIKNADSGVYPLYSNEIYIKDVNVQSSVVGIKIGDSSQITISESDAVANNTGISFSNTHFTSISVTGAVDSLTSHGIVLSSSSNISISSSFLLNSASDGINMTDCSNINISAISSLENAGQGIELVSGNSDIIINGCAFENNGSDGIKLTATTDNCQFIGNSIKDNGGYGVNIAASSCDGNNITGNNFSGNATSAANDSGTGTVIRGNVGLDDNSTGAQQVGVLLNQFIAGESISINDAVYIASKASIAFDVAASVVGSATSPLTLSHTCTGSNRVLFVGIETVGDTTDRVSVVTYNGVACTRINTVSLTDRRSYLYYIIAPTAGANNVSVTHTSGNCSIYSASYTGAIQGGIPDASNTNSGSGVTSLTTSVTTVADNTWTVAFMSSDSGNNVTAGAGTTLRHTGFSSIGDSNGAITPPGSSSLVVNIDRKSVV